MSEYTLFNGDCLNVLPASIPDQSVDAIITDLPYGTTACAWDVVIPFEPMWAQVKRVLKPRGVFVTTASQPFTSMLVMSNLEWFKQELIWRKDRSSGFMHAKNNHLKAHENIVVFSSGIIAHAGSPNRMTYNPQGTILKSTITNGKRPDRDGGFRLSRPSLKHERIQEQENYPTSVLIFSSTFDIDHPTQKPVALYEYLIRTYTNHGAKVLDIAAGSGTTGVACMRTGRDFIGIEKESDYYEIAQRRISEAAAQPALFHLDAPTIKPTQTALDFTGEAHDA